MTAILYSDIFIFYIGFYWVLFFALIIFCFDCVFDLIIDISAKLFPILFLTAHCYQRIAL